MDNKSIILLVLAVLGWALREIYLHSQKKHEISDKKIDELKTALASNTLVQQELKIEIRHMKDTFDDLKLITREIKGDVDALHSWKRSLPPIPKEAQEQ